MQLLSMQPNKMFLLGATLVLLISLQSARSQELPTVYEYFTDGGINSGLVAQNNEFSLNGKTIRILSGAMHHFRVLPELRRDRLRKLRSLGLNTVETYTTWNLHEPRKGQFDFGNGNNDFSEFMDIRKFVQMAQEEDLLVIIRPGPFICAEWDWGALPSWLARDPDMRVRQNYQPYIERVNIYMEKLLEQLVDLQFKNGGPIIAMQIENEYANFEPRSREYLESIRESFIQNGFEDTLFFTADNQGWIDYDGSIPGVLQTANTHDPDGSFTKILEIQPDMPLMAMEYYTGWFAHWFDERRGQRDPQDYVDNLEKVLGKYNGSVNLYPVHGGTTYGFMAGANTISDAPYFNYDITSYDFDALISEAGDYTYKFGLTEEILAKYENPKLRRIPRPLESLKIAYDTIQIASSEYLTYEDIIEQVPSSQKVTLDKAVSMENLPINEDNGQSHGYVVYRTTRQLNADDRYRVTRPRDLAQVVVDGIQLDTGYTDEEQPKYIINSVEEFQFNVSPDQDHTIDLIVESMGRVNHGWSNDFIQDKGIAAAHDAKIEINDEELSPVEVIALEFKNEWVKSLSNWKMVTDGTALQAPCLVKGKFTIGDNDQPADTFLDMSEWHRGAVFINGFNIGRYWKVGPPQTLYVPAPLLKQGENEVVIFEQFELGSEIKFRTEPILD